jgi:hypothetical protein
MSCHSQRARNSLRAGARKWEEPESVSAFTINAEGFGPYVKLLVTAGVEKMNASITAASDPSEGSSPGAYGSFDAGGLALGVGIWVSMMALVPMFSLLSSLGI